MATQDFREELSDELLEVGVSLASIRTEGTAWYRAHVFQVLDALRDTHWAVLGGDVLRVAGQQIEYTDDNWLSQLRSGETRREFVTRSIEEATLYIANYPDDATDGRHLFALVCGRVV
jgi:hypothetical protein